MEHPYLVNLRIQAKFNPKISRLYFVTSLKKITREYFYTFDHLVYVLTVEISIRELLLVYFRHMKKCIEHFLLSDWAQHKLDNYYFLGKPAESSLHLRQSPRQIIDSNDKVCSPRWPKVCSRISQWHFYVSGCSWSIPAVKRKAKCLWNCLKFCLVWMPLKHL